MSQNYVYPSSSSVTLTGTPNNAPIPSTSLLVASENTAGNQVPLQSDAAGALLVSPLTTSSVVKADIQDTNGAAITLGIKVAASSLPVVLASDTTLPLPAGAATSALQTSGNASLTSIGTSTASIDSKLATLGQKTMTGSEPVVIASDQSAIPTTVASLPLPAGAATSANQATEISSLASIVTSTASIDSKTPALGQALAASSVPIVLTAAQLTILTPLTSVTVTQATGTNLHTVVDSSALPTGGAVSALQTVGNTALGNIFSTLSNGTQKSQIATPIAGTITQAAITVGTTALRLTVSGTVPSATRLVLVVTPDAGSTGKFYIGSSSVTATGATRGIQIAAGQSFIANNDAGDYYIISDTAAQTVEVMEQ